MPYFIERIIKPLDEIRALAQWAGFKHVEDLKGMFTLDHTEGIATGDFTGRRVDLLERLRIIGLDVRLGSMETAGDNAVEYAELLVYSEKPPDADGCGKICIIGNEKWLISEGPNPFHHGLKSYSEVKYSPRAAQIWQAKGLPELIEQQQEKLNIRMAQVGDIIEDIRSPMTYVEKGAVEDKNDLLPWPGAIIEVNKLAGIQPRIRPGVPSDIFRDIDYTRAGIQRTSSNPDWSSGAASKTGGIARGTETLGGIQALLNSANQAKSFKWRLAEELGISEGLNIVAALIQQVVTEPQKIRILGENKVLRNAGWKQFFVVSPEDIQGQWNFFAVGASTALDKATQAELLTKMVTGWFQMPEVAPRIKQYDVAIEGGELAGIHNPRRFLMGDEEWAQKQQEMAQSQPNPVQQAAQIELVKSLDYRDAPPDVKMQIEQLAGLTPSQLYGLQTALEMLQKGKNLMSQPQSPRTVKAAK